MTDDEKKCLAWAINFISKIGVRNPEDAALYIAFAAFVGKTLKEQTAAAEAAPKKN